MWWTCKNDGEHRYKMSLYSRVLFEKRHKEPCLICKGRRRKRHILCFSRRFRKTRLLKCSLVFFSLRQFNKRSDYIKIL
nr:hypothetical protein [Streptococcus parasanguinis]